MPRRSSPAVVVAVPTPAIVSARDMETEERDDFEEAEVDDDVTVELIKSVKAEMGRVEGGKVDAETDSSSEAAECVDEMGACESMSVWKDDANASSVGGSGEKRRDVPLYPFGREPYDDRLEDGRNQSE
ncbi:tRNA-splicing endonuclease [Pseudozyma hubeiensis SY62]|uniref:tRNA-splicing endonuclease n=1 Tax=Pseudozyma hubeiensis (strain SY62) TaxID=1305764 RepID=R9P5H5_PSEHS|nr:tRNA-splicing endonuclease [Pseudozyma hubeiensis SY62]GAC96616.1 tRNA-splicing endonuclease [Pseudozyma hubeiensis SY62]